MSPVRSTACERAREQLSLRLDGELSQLEGAFLRAHLGRCAGCQTFEAHIEAFTSELRSSPLEQLPQPVALPYRRRVSFRGVQAVAAAAAVLVVAGATSIFATSSQQSGALTLAASEALQNDAQRELRLMPGTQPGELPARGERRGEPRGGPTIAR